MPPESVKCPFCNYMTPYPQAGRVAECTGECFSTYTLVSSRDDLLRTKMKLVEIFFLDGHYNIYTDLKEIDLRCEFRILPSHDASHYIMFSREYRVLDDDIESLKKEAQGGDGIEAEFIERLHSSLGRFEKNLKNMQYPQEKLLNELKVVETLLKNIRDHVEKTHPKSLPV